MTRVMRSAQLLLAAVATIVGLGGIASPAAAAVTGAYSYTTPTFTQGTNTQAGVATITEVFAGKLLSLSDCSGYKICIWTSTSYSGSRKEIADTGVNTCVNLSSPYDNNASSTYNPGIHTFTLWESYNGTGSRALSVDAGFAYSSFSGMSPYWADNIASSVCRSDA